jgi:hypothetical protein
MAEKGERWPPVYDADDLIREIKRLTSNERLEQGFFEWRRDRSTFRPADICQGDVIVLDSGVPVILEDGAPGIVDHPDRAWLVIGNSCDFDRAVSDARWTQLVPIESAGSLSEVTPTEVNAARRYTQTRRFYVPPWSKESEADLQLANLLLPVAIDKRALRATEHGATLHARMSRPAWFLLNACLVRFLARDDGRYDG